jgi:hypothetical protein
MIVDVATLILFEFMRVATYLLAWASTLRGCDLGYFKPYDQFSFLISNSLHILIQQRLIHREM